MLLKSTTGNFLRKRRKSCPDSLPLLEQGRSRYSDNGMQTGNSKKAKADVIAGTQIKNDAGPMEYGCQ